MGTSGNGNGNGNGNGDWAASFAAFYDRHRGKDQKKLKFTGVFNAHLECLMDEPELPIEWKCLAWSWRQSWGNNSDFCVDKIGGHRVGQKECAARLGVKKQRVSDAFVYLKGLYYIEPSKGYAIFPVDNPSERRAKSPAPSGLSDTQITQFQAWCDDWRVRYPADSQELQSAGETVERIKRVRLGLYRESVRASRKGDAGVGASLYITSQPVEQGPSSSVPPVETGPTEPTTTTTLTTFHEEHVAAWTRAGKESCPTVRQSADAFEKLGERSQAFLRWLTPKKLKRIEHPGAIPALVKEFLTKMVPAQEPEAEKCWHCGKPIAGASVNGACFECFETNSSLQAQGAAS